MMASNSIMVGEIQRKFLLEIPKKSYEKTLGIYMFGNVMASNSIMVEP